MASAASATTATKKDVAAENAAIRKEMGKDRIIDLYTKMLRIRRFEERAGAKYQEKKIAGFLHLYIGQEAVGVGFYDHLDFKTDFSVTSYRCHAQALLSGCNMDELMAELYGKVTGNVRGKGGSMHFFNKENGMLGGHGIVGGQTPVGTGAAFTCMYNESGGVSVTFMGDGAVAQGSFHESLNLASLWSLPAVYVIENNQYGMGTAAHRAVSVTDMADAKAAGYNMNGYTFDGLDLYQSWKTAQKAIAEARAGHPVLIEAKTYRYRGHSVSDPGKAYRSRDEVEEYKKRDPILRIAADLRDEGWMKPDELEALDEEVMEEVMAAVAFAEDSPEPPMHELTRHVFSED